MWTKQFGEVSDFAWATARKPPEWDLFKSTLKSIQEKGFLKEEGDVSVQMFRQFGYLKAYMTVEKISKWNSDKTPPDLRWVECFKHFDENEVPYHLISMIIQYIYCLPGTSASVERVFSAVNKIWTNEKTRLQVKTLKSILIVKYNMAFSCLEFFKFLKSKPDLLAKIAAQEKYTNTTVCTPEVENREEDEESL